MESLYKRRGKVGLADRAKRSELSKQNSKAKKAEVIDSRRRLPLGELNVAGKWEWLIKGRQIILFSNVYT